MENTVANYIAAWLTFEQLSCKFENVRSPTPLPIGITLLQQFVLCYYSIMCKRKISQIFAKNVKDIINI